MLTRIAVSSCLAVLGMAASVNAADLDDIIYAKELPMTKPVEIGSGWYLRGDLGYSVSTKRKNSDVVTVNPFTGLTPFASVVSSTFSESDSDLNGSVGVGYSFTDMFRADLNLGIMRMSSAGLNGTLQSGCAGTETVETVNYDALGNVIVPSTITTGASSRDCAGTASIKSDLYSGMLNGYVDLGTFAGFTPYVGAGIGVAISRVEVYGTGRCENDQTVTGIAGVSQTTTSFVCNGSTSVTDPAIDYSGLNYDNTKYSLAYSLSAGLGYQVSKNLTFDLGYQFVSAPNAEYAYFGANGVNIAKGVDTHNVRAGLRYALW